MNVKNKAFIALPVVAALWCLPAIAESELHEQNQTKVEHTGIYRTREERREAGLGTPLTDWLTFSGLVEVETSRELTQFNTSPDSTPYPDHYDFETEPAVQAAFDFSFLDLFEAELILEYTEDSRDPIMDEFIIASDIGNLGFSVGRFYAPFGLYYSHFIDGPVLEFAETRRDMIQLDFDFDDQLEWSVFAFDGESRQLRDSDKDIGWGTTVDALLLNGRLNVGAGYISNLAESDEELLEEFNNVFSRRVGAWNGYIVYEADTWDLSLEYLVAANEFAEFDKDKNKPESWNIETAFFPTGNFELALRYQRSKELADEPEEQYGMALTWRLGASVSMSVEYLYSSYQREFVEVDDEVFSDSANSIAAWIAFEF